MLIYNYEKKFMGIMQSYLDVFGLTSLEELQTNVADFADLFVSSPGYIYNFEHVHWIDYVLYDDSGVAPKVLIDINGFIYSANLELDIIYLTDEPLQKAYCINLINLKAKISDTDEKDDSEEKTDKVEKHFFDPLKIDYDDKIIEDIQTESDDMPIKINDIYEEPSLKVKDEDENDALKIAETYVFDPEIASKELGLPLDLVEEFIQDFIDQANSFKDDLHTSTITNDNNRIKTLSHKLKGVAANLRIQDALDILTDINTSEDLNQIKKDLDTFYKIIDKLTNNTSASDNLVLNIKDDV